MTYLAAAIEAEARLIRAGREGIELPRVPFLKTWDAIQCRELLNQTWDWADRTPPRGCVTWAVLHLPEFSPSLDRCFDDIDAAFRAKDPRSLARALEGFAAVIHGAASAFSNRRAR